MKPIVLSVSWLEPQKKKRRSDLRFRSTLFWKGWSPPVLFGGKLSQSFPRLRDLRSESGRRRFIIVFFTSRLHLRSGSRQVAKKCVCHLLATCGWFIE